MPQGKTHLKIGFIAITVYLIVYSILFNLPKIRWWMWLLLIPISYIYSLIPDIDSYFGKLRTLSFKLIFTILCFSLLIPILFKNIFLFLMVLTIVGLFGLFIMKSKHRGPLHTYTFILACSLCLLWIHWFFVPIGFIAGSSHIIADRLRTKLKRTFKTRTHEGVTNNYVKINNKNGAYNYHKHVRE